MDKKLKRKWVKALRSGEYPQGVGSLWEGKKDTKYCCLGVLCEVAGARKVGCGEYEYAGNRMGGSLDGPLAEMLAPNEKYYGNSGNVQSRLVSANDGFFSGRRFTFDEIADWIEEVL